MPRGGRDGSGRTDPPSRFANQSRSKNAHAARHPIGDQDNNDNGQAYSGRNQQSDSRLAPHYHNGYGQSGMNGYTPQAAPVPSNPSAQAASPLDLLMSAIAASAGGGTQTMQNVAGMGGGVQNFGLGHLHNVPGMAMGGLGGLGTQMNGSRPAPTHQPALPPFDHSHATAQSLDQIFGHNAFSAAASAASPADTNPASLPTPFQVNLLMNLLGSQNGNVSGAQMGPPPPQATQPFGQPNMPATPLQQTRSGRISRPPANPAPLFPDWSQLSGLMNQQNMGGGNPDGNAPFPSQAVLRAMQVLQQPGMEHVRQALASTGWLDQLGAKQGQAGSRQSMAEYPGPTIPYQQSPDPQQRGYTNNHSPSSNGNKRRKRHSDPDSDRGEFAASGRASNRSTAFGAANDGHAQDDNDDDNHSDEPGAPPFPRPLVGKGSRSTWSKEEAQLRRKERNKQSAIRYRAKRESQMEELQTKVDQKEEEIRTMQEKCDRLEQEVNSLRNYILTAGLSLPGSTCQTPTLAHSQGMQTTLVRDLGEQGNTEHAPEVYMRQTPAAPQGPLTSQSSHTPMTAVPQSDGLYPGGSFGNGGPLGNSNPTDTAIAHPASTSSGQAAFDASVDQLFDFNLFMNFDGLDDDDDDFQPETSPHNASGSESESEDDDADDDGTPRASAIGSKRKKSAKKSRAAHRAHGEAGVTPIYTDTEATPRDRDDEDYIDPEMEDEDLFLPIEDVPIPPEALVEHSGGRSGTRTQAEAPMGAMNDLTRDLMAALNVETRDQLAAVMRKLVDSAGDGVGEDVREKLKSVMYLAQAPGDQVQSGGGSGDDGRQPAGQIR